MKKKSLITNKYYREGWHDAVGVMIHTVTKVRNTVIEPKSRNDAVMLMHTQQLITLLSECKDIQAYLAKNFPKTVKEHKDG